MRMSETVSVLVSLLVLASLLGLSGQCSTPPPPPAIGDIRLVPYNDDPTLTEYYEVQIYYTDGLVQADYGGVCADNLYKEESKVICHQVGYKYIDFQYRSITTPLWFNHIQCDNSNSPHILRCKTNVTSSANRENSGNCGPENNRLLVKCDFTQPLTPYNGQVALCPIDNNSPNISSTSFGLVGIYYENYGAWKGINQRGGGRQLGAYDADTICRQMGFTGAYPGTAVIRNVENYDFDQCFSDTGNEPPFRFKDGAWATTDDINCQEPQNCLGCCLRFPYRGDCGNCDTQYNLVIRCAFDPMKMKLNDGTAGSEDKCEVDSNKNVKQCTTADKFIATIKHLKIALGVVVPFLLVLLGLCGCCICYTCYKSKLYHQCTVKPKCVNTARAIILCCKDYKPINEVVNNGEENARINQQA